MTSEKTHPSGNLSILTEVLCWERYGYWSECGGPPAWASERLTDAKHFASIVNPADYRMSCDVTKEPNGTSSAKYAFYDAANPWVEPWAMTVVQCRDEASARQYVEKEFASHKRLHDGVIDALIHYATTGEPTLPAWMPESQWYFRLKSYKPDNRAYLREGEPGVICHETFDGNAPLGNKDTIHVEIQACGANNYVAECFAEGSNQYRRQRSKRFEAPTYAEAKKLAETWISEFARPFIAHELANPVDYVEFDDPATGKTITGELFGVDADGSWRDAWRIKLDDPKAMVTWRRDGIVTIDKSLIRRVDKPAK